MQSARWLDETPGVGQYEARMSRNRARPIPHSLSILVASVLLCALPSSGWAQAVPQNGEWKHYAGTTYGMKYSPLDQITRHNIGDVDIVWRSPNPDLAFQSDPILSRVRYQDTPLMVNGTLFSVTGLGIIMALDPATGEKRWTYDPGSYKAGRPNNGGFLARGVAYWTDGTAERLLIGTHDAYLLSLDARTGQPDQAFGVAGQIDLTVGIRNVMRSTNFSAKRPLVAGDVVIIGNSIQDAGRGTIGNERTRQLPPGDVQAFDVRTGRKLWTFHTVPKEYEAGYETWLNGSAEHTGNANVWAGMAYDPELDYVYMPTSTPTNDTYGGDRLGDNLYAESLVCVRAKTGERVWHFQVVHHGLWDYDFASMPVLGEITVDGRQIKAVMLASKQAFTYVFDRETGEPVWPIEERPVPASTVPGEHASPTQPFPAKPPPFDIQGATVENLMDFTPELRQSAIDALDEFVHGPVYTPPSLEGTIAVPGTRGGSNWGGAGFDPDTNVLYVPSRTAPAFLRVGATRSPSEAQRRLMRCCRSVVTKEGLPLFKPPYARLTAIDMNRGEHLWMSPLGNGPRNHPLLRDMDLPPLGDHIDGQSVLVTKTLVFATVWRRDRGSGEAPIVPMWDPWGDPDAGRKLVYVFDKQTGELLREIELSGHTAAAPMSYLHEGRQYIAVATGANDEVELVALALPE